MPFPLWVNELWRIFTLCHIFVSVLRMSFIISFTNGKRKENVKKKKKSKKTTIKQTLVGLALVHTIVFISRELWQLRMLRQCHHLPACAQITNWVGSARHEVAIKQQPEKAPEFPVSVTRLGGHVSPTAQVTLPWNLWLRPTNGRTDSRQPLQQNAKVQLRNQALLSWGMISF